MTGRGPDSPNLRRPTATSAFGVGRREGHDATEFYRRFSAPAISDDDSVCHPDDRPVVDRIVLGDIRDHPKTVADNSVALVVTSPPYFAGKEYETAIGQGHVPASYGDYLAMVHGVLAACVRALEPGGRMAVNVANLGRKPYRSLSADVIGILTEELGLLLRGEIVWRKARGAAGNCAWGSYQRPADPVLRDLTERVVVASKGRFDRALGPRTRHAGGYPSEASMWRDEFLEATTDVWELAPQSAVRANHPAPFPVELPQRLIDLYTYRGDLVLDPFAGSGTTAAASIITQRNYLGYDTDPGYVAAATERLEQLKQRQRRDTAGSGYLDRPVLPAVATSITTNEHYLTRAVREGRRARELARWALDAAGFTVTTENARLGPGVDVGVVAQDRAGRSWAFDVLGGFGSGSGGLRRADTLWKALGKATVLHHTGHPSRFVLLSTDKPSANSAGGRALEAVTGPDTATKPVYDVIALTDRRDLDRLERYGRGWDQS